MDDARLLGLLFEEALLLGLLLPERQDRFSEFPVDSKSAAGYVGLELYFFDMGLYKSACMLIVGWT